LVFAASRTSYQFARQQRQLTAFAAAGMTETKLEQVDVKKEEAGEHGESFTAPMAVTGAIDVSEYQPQLARKLEKLKALLSSLPLNGNPDSTQPTGGLLPEIEVFESEPMHCECPLRFLFQQFIWGQVPWGSLPAAWHYVPLCVGLWQACGLVAMSLVVMVSSCGVADRMRAEFTVWGTSAKAAKSGDPPDVHFIMYDSNSKTKPPPR
jgi:hypothetical protein